MITLATFFGLPIGSWAEWVGGLSTTAAVILALWPLLRKPRPKIYFVEVDHTSRTSLPFSKIAYTNPSEAAGMYRLKSCRWRDKDNKWHDYYAKYFSTAFSAMPYQQTTELNKSTFYAYPDKYSPTIPNKKDLIGGPQHEKVDWIETQLIYEDEETRATAILKFSRNNGSTKMII